MDGGGEVTVHDLLVTEHKAYFKLLSHNIIKRQPIRMNQSMEIENPETFDQKAEASIKEMLDAMADPDVAELVKMFSLQIRP